MDYLRSTNRTHEKNELRTLIDGEVVYSELLAAIRGAKRFIYIATWSMDPGLELTRNQTGGSRLEDVLLERARAGVEVKLLTWDYLSVISPLGSLAEIFRPDLHRFKRELREAGAKFKRGTSLSLSTNLHKPPGRRYATGSDHQKFWLMDDAGNQAFGFVGGLNLGQHEWDTSEHIPGDQRRSSPGINRQGLELQHALRDPLKKYLARSLVEKALEERFKLSQWIAALPQSDAEKALMKDWIIAATIRYLKSQKPSAPRHDVSAEIRGPVVAELIKEFRVRWHLANSGKIHEGSKKISSLPAGKTQVQIGHTAYYPQPGNKTDIWRAYIHALHCAENYIYIENQFFVSPHIAKAIANRVKKFSNLQVVLILPSVAEDFAIAPAVGMRQNQLINQLVMAAHKLTPHDKRVHVFALRRWDRTIAEYESIYVHAKVALIDDRWMTIGSANCSPRSLEFDTELNVFTNQSSQVISLRNKLWSEHLDIPQDNDILKDSGRTIRKMVETAESNAKTQKGELKGRLVPISFQQPFHWLDSLYEQMAQEFL